MIAIPFFFVFLSQGCDVRDQFKYMCYFDQRELSQTKVLVGATLEWFGRGTPCFDINGIDSMVIHETRAL